MLTKTYRDFDERLVLHCTIDGKLAAVSLREQFHEAIDAAFDAQPDEDDWRFGGLVFKTRPARGAQISVAYHWVTEEWWRQKRREAGRHD